MAFALLALTALASMAIDAGIWRYQQQLAQTAADSGALAAVEELKNSGTAAALYTFANIDTTANGFAGGSSSGTTNTGTKVTVTVHSPPASGPSSTDSDAVEVIVQKTLPVYFGPWSTSVYARAVATYSTPGYCMTALDTNSTPAIMLDGGTIEMPNCGMISNSQMTFNGGTIDAKSIGYVKSLSGSATYVKATPAMTTAVADPCSSVTACANLESTVPTPGTCNANQVITAPVTITPGTYCNTIFQGSGTVTLSAGFYYFTNGFNVNGSVNIAGNNVTLYNAAGAINFGQGTENLVAPTTGNYANVVYFQPATNSNTLTFNGTATAVLNGLVYVPGGQLILDGTSSTWTQVIAKDITINASGSLTFNAASSSGTSGLSE